MKGEHNGKIAWFIYDICGPNQLVLDLTQSCEYPGVK